MIKSIKKDLLEIYNYNKRLYLNKTDLYENLKLDLGELSEKYNCTFIFDYPALYKCETSGELIRGYIDVVWLDSNKNRVLAIELDSTIAFRLDNLNDSVSMLKLTSNIYPNKIFMYLGESSDYLNLLIRNYDKENEILCLSPNINKNIPLDEYNQYYKDIDIKTWGSHLYETIKSNQKPFKKLLIVNIGTDRCVNDSLGPLVGYFLNKANINVEVIGILNDNIDGKSYDILPYAINDDYFVIAIDSGTIKLENTSRLGNIIINNKGLLPRSAKEIPNCNTEIIIGDMSISGITYEFEGDSDIKDFIYNQNIPLIVEMADVITKIILECYRLLRLEEVYKDELNEEKINYIYELREKKRLIESEEQLLSKNIKRLMNNQNITEFKTDSYTAYIDMKKKASLNEEIIKSFLLSNGFENVFNNSIEESEKPYLKIRQNE